MTKRIAIIGAGRVGRALGRALRERGWRIGAVITSKRASARAAVRAIGGGKAGWRVSDWPFDCDVLIVSVPDRDIEVMADVLSLMLCWRTPGLRKKASLREAAAKKALRGKVVLHTSGAQTHLALSALKEHGAAIGAMHPMQTFGLGARTRLDGVVFGLDGDAQALRVARRIVRSLGGIPANVKPARKPVYHLSGGFAAPHLLAVLETGVRILMAAGYSRTQATKALCFMARQNIANLERYGARRAWTGPLARGDWGTIAKHAAALRRFPPEYRQAYVAIARLAARVLSPHPRKMLRELDRIFKTK